MKSILSPLDPTNDALLRPRKFVTWKPDLSETHFFEMIPNERVNVHRLMLYRKQYAAFHNCEEGWSLMGIDVDEERLPILPAEERGKYSTERLGAATDLTCTPVSLRSEPVVIPLDSDLPTSDVTPLHTTAPTVPSYQTTVYRDCPDVSDYSVIPNIPNYQSFCHQDNSENLPFMTSSPITDELMETDDCFFQGNEIPQEQQGLLSNIQEQNFDLRSLLNRNRRKNFVNNLPERQTHWSINPKEDSYSFHKVQHNGFNTFKKKRPFKPQRSNSHRNRSASFRY